MTAGARRVRLFVIVMVLAIAVAACGPGSGNATTGTSTIETAVNTSTTASTAPLDLGAAEAALVDLARQSGTDVIYSPVASVPGGSVAVITYGSPERVDVVRFEDNAWQPITTLSTPIGAVIATGIEGPQTCDVQCIEIASLTGLTNFLLTLPGADHVQLMVLEVADDARSARVVPFDDHGELLAGVRSGTVDGQTITSDDNNCIPSCAEGISTYTPWTYDPTAEMFRPAVGDDA